MNIYEKLQNMRVELQEKNIKKSGLNKYAGYHYFELADILPTINELQMKYKTFSQILFEKENAKLIIINTENLEESVEFISPLAELNLKGANAIQNIGGIQTYLRRYLYLMAFEVVEADYFDAIQGKSNKKMTNRELLIQKLNAKGIEMNTYAKEKGLNKNTSETRYEELLNELIED